MRRPRGPIRLGSRNSELALKQAGCVAHLIHQGMGLESEIIPFTTVGDEHTNLPATGIGELGVFVSSLEKALEKGEIDIAVHSAKDLPSVLAADFEVIAFTKRINPSEVLLGPEDSPVLAENFLDRNCQIGTSSLRRRALLQKHYPHVQVVLMRGNIGTRIEKMKAGSCDLLMLARAGLERLGFPQDLCLRSLDLSDFPPPAGQGSLAVEIHKSFPSRWRETLRMSLNHAETDFCVRAERTFLRGLNMGCHHAVHALARSINGDLLLHAGLFLPAQDGTVFHLHHRARAKKENFNALGFGLAKKIKDLAKEGGRSVERI
ncbi:MAG: hydroxymethylbilane synthase [Cytophagales bacterium]|nr:hydroxymethylbilane synthase [Cytophagales bacterium]